MTIRRRTALGAALALPFAARSQGTRWQMATPYPDGNFHTRNIRTFLEGVERAAGGALSVQVHSNASLLQMPAIKRGVQTGQVQLGEILISAYANEDPMFEIDGIPQVVATYAQAKRLADLSRPFIEARFARQGLSVLFMVPWPPSGFYANEAIGSLEVFRGKKFRTFNAATNRFATLIGAVPTLVQAAEIPQAFATGVVNAMVTSAQTGVDTQAWDYCRFFTPVGFTFTKNVVFVSRRALEALPAPVQAAIREQAAAAEERGWQLSAEAQSSAQATLASRGMTVTDPAPAAVLDGLNRVGATMLEEWLAKAGDDGRTLVNQLRAAG